MTFYRNYINCIKLSTFWEQEEKSSLHNTNTASSKGQLGLFVKIKTTQDDFNCISSLFFKLSKACEAVT